MAPQYRLLLRKPAAAASRGPWKPRQRPLPCARVAMTPLPAAARVGGHRGPAGSCTSAAFTALLPGAQPLVSSQHGSWGGGTLHRRAPEGNWGGHAAVSPTHLLSCWPEPVCPTAHASLSRQPPPWEPRGLPVGGSVSSFSRTLRFASWCIRLFTQFWKVLSHLSSLVPRYSPFPPSGISRGSRDTALTLHRAETVNLQGDQSTATRTLERNRG